MTKKRNMLIAALFALAIGSAFTNNAESLRYLGPFQKTGASCPPVTSLCTKPSGIICANIYLDNACTVQAYRQ